MMTYPKDERILSVLPCAKADGPQATKRPTTVGNKSLNIIRILLFHATEGSNARHQRRARTFENEIAAVLRVRCMPLLGPPPPERGL